MYFPPAVLFGLEFGNSKLYMSCLTKDKTPDGLLEFNPTTAVPSLQAKFVVERAGDEGLVHIRSCYNNKYWCRSVRNGSYIIADAKEPVENTKALNCTLFRPRFLGSSYSRVAFTHIQSGASLINQRDNNDWSKWYVTIGLGGLHFWVLDFGSLVRLPKRVIFNGDNAKYLRSREHYVPLIVPPHAIHYYERFPREKPPVHNEFLSEDKAEKAAQYMIIQKNGTIRLKSLKFGKFLRRNSDNWICSDADDTTSENPDTLFEVIKVDQNLFALRNKGNNKFCRRANSDDAKQNSCLKASELELVPEARFGVVDPAFDRKIGVEYNLKDAKIISEKPVRKDTLIAHNYSSSKEDTTTLKFNFNKTTSHTWSVTTTFTLGVKVELKCKFPMIVGKKIELSAELSVAGQFGKTESKSEEVGAEYKITVPPRSKGIVHGFVKEVTFDVPFAYTMTDRYIDGDSDTIRLEDGVYHGVQGHEFLFDKLDYEPL